jgi:hypothetical protein
MIYGKDNVAMPQKSNGIVLQDNGKAISQSPTEESGATQNANEKKPVNSNTYYILGKTYLIFCATIALIITLAPKSWFSIPQVAKIQEMMVSKMPGLVYLAGLSSTPQEIIAAYCITFLAAPIHCILLAAIVASRFNSGFYDPKKFRQIVKWCWVFFAWQWLQFFTCFFCLDEPTWRGYVQVSSRLFVAIFQQGFVALSVMYPATILARLFTWVSRDRINIPIGRKSHGRQE